MVFPRILGDSNFLHTPGAHTYEQRLLWDPHTHKATPPLLVPKFLFLTSNILNKREKLCSCEMALGAWNPCLFIDWENKGGEEVFCTFPTSIFLFKEHSSSLPSLWEQFISLINHFIWKKNTPATNYNL